ncbi:two-component system sensor kinase [Salmonella enterica subsp. arizonae]|uniref:Two-component system sensor kinase n=1 Tax=Salmonella enterica subsp. arizonae TaxID=59203 RepID=A0A379SM13_SALER|nr:two-component system sensor kinase [Salmonella enterica subsp. arizonae]
MKVWRPGITGKLFLAIFATCIVLLISMHWAVRVSFERGFIDYIKHGNEQRLQMLGDALGEQYQQHGNWRFLRNNDRFVFRFCVHLSTTTTVINPALVCRRTVGVPSSGWSIKMAGCWSAHAARCRMTVLVGPFWSMATKSARLSPPLSSG